MTSALANWLTLIRKAKDKNDLTEQIAAMALYVLIKRLNSENISSHTAIIFCQCFII